MDSYLVLKHAYNFPTFLYIAVFIDRMEGSQVQPPLQSVFFMPPPTPANYSLIFQPPLTIPHPFIPRPVHALHNMPPPNPFTPTPVYTRHNMHPPHPFTHHPVYTAHNMPPRHSTSFVICPPFPPPQLPVVLIPIARPKMANITEL